MSANAKCEHCGGALTLDGRCPAMDAEDIAAAKAAMREPGSVSWEQLKKSLRRD